VELGDKRLNNRLVKLAQQLAAHPTASIPVAYGGWGDTAAAHRLLDNERCDWREIEAHGRWLCSWWFPGASPDRCAWGALARICRHQRIGFSNALFPSRLHPEHGKTTAEQRWDTAPEALEPAQSQV
jgi:hypothetical protein